MTTMMVLMEGECKLGIPQMQLAALSLCPGHSLCPGPPSPYCPLPRDASSLLESLLTPLGKAFPAGLNPSSIQFSGPSGVYNCPWGKALGFKWYWHP